MDFTLVFVCLMTYVSYIFLLDTTIFAITEDEKEEKNSVLQVLEFWGILLKFKEKILKIYKPSWLSITWALKKLNSTQTLSDNIPEIKFSHWSLLSKTYRNLYLITQTLIALNNFVFYRNNRLVLLQIFSYRLSIVAAPISSYSHSNI